MFIIVYLFLTIFLAQTLFICLFLSISPYSFYLTLLSLSHLSHLTLFNSILKLFVIEGPKHLVVKAFVIFTIIQIYLTFFFNLEYISKSYDLLFVAVLGIGTEFIQWWSPFTKEYASLNITLHIFINTVFIGLLKLAFTFLWTYFAKAVASCCGTCFSDAELNKTFSK